MLDTVLTTAPACPWGGRKARGSVSEIELVTTDGSFSLKAAQKAHLDQGGRLRKID